MAPATIHCILLSSQVDSQIGGSISVVEVPYLGLLALGAFWLGACPFSVWIGRWLLHRDVREYGNGNPGAANVFLAIKHFAELKAVPRPGGRLIHWLQSRRHET